MRLMSAITTLNKVNQYAARLKFVKLFIVAEDDIWYILYYKAQNLLVLRKDWWIDLFTWFALCEIQLTC